LGLLSPNKKKLGFFAKLLRINLTKQNYFFEDISQEVLRTYLGGKGLGSYLLLNEVTPGTDPLSPNNKLIFTGGSSTGTGMWGSSRYGIFSKSPQTGLYGESYSGGKVASALNKTGYDAILPALKIIFGVQPDELVWGP